MTPAKNQRATATLFFVQIFSTMAFSVLFSTLVLYITKKLHLSNVDATAITGSFIAFNYALHLLGGYCGGRMLSYRNLFGIGMLLQVGSCFLIAVPSTSALYWGLAAFLTGAGMNVTCVNCMLTQLFTPQDLRRESAFLWNYSGMNIGFLIGFTVSGHFQLMQNYHELFLLTGVSSLIALVIAVGSWKDLDDKNTFYKNKSLPHRFRSSLAGLGIILALLFGLHLLLNHAKLSSHLIMLTGLLMAIVIAVLAVQQKTANGRRKMWAYWLLTMSSLIFWILYNVMPTGLTLFIEHNVNTHVFGLIIPPQWVMNINSIVIIIGGPLLTWAFKKLRARGINITLPLQFSSALILVGLGFVILPLGIKLADPQGYTAFSWIAACYTLQSLGELLISPIGYSMIGFLVPERLQGLCMGTWMLMIGVSATFASYFSTLAISATASNNPLLTNMGFSHTFAVLGWMAVAAGVALAGSAPLLHKLIHEKKLSFAGSPLNSVSN